MIKTVVFDLGGVLVDWSPRYVYSRERDSYRLDRFLAEVATGEWNSQMDAGELFQTAIDQRAAEFPEWREWLQKWRDEWPTMLRGPIDGTVSLFEQVVEQRRRGHLAGVYALSNWEANTFKIARARFPFLELFDGRLISGEERMIKPDPRFFHLLQKRFSIVPSETLFIDDVAKNIDAAEAIGFQTHHFTSPEALQAVLLKRGVIQSI